MVTSPFFKGMDMSNVELETHYIAVVTLEWQLLLKCAQVLADKLSD